MWQARRFQTEAVPRVWLLDEIREADDNVQESNRFPNSYGSGFDWGWRQALERVRLKLDDKLDD